MVARDWSLETAVEIVNGYTKDSENFTGTATVLGDVGRALVHPNEKELRSWLAATGAARDRLAYGEGLRHAPRTMLMLKDGEEPTYPAGALWAGSTVVSSFLVHVGTELTRADERAGRGAMRELFIELLQEHGSLTPSDFQRLAAERGQPISASQTSRVLAVLQEAGRVEPVAPIRGGDRRRRYYVLADPSATAQPKVPATLRDGARRLIRELKAFLTDDEVEGLLVGLVKGELVLDVE